MGKCTLPSAWWWSPVQLSEWRVSLFSRCKALPQIFLDATLAALAHCCATSTCPSHWKGRVWPVNGGATIFRDKNHNVRISQPTSVSRFCVQGFMIDTETKSFVDVRSMTVSFIELYHFWVFTDCSQVVFVTSTARKHMGTNFTDPIYIIFISGFEIQFRCNLLKASSSQIIFQIDL